MSGIWLVSHIALWVLFLVIAIVLVSILRNLGVLAEALQALQHSGGGASIKLQSGAGVPDLPLQTLQGATIRTSAFAGKATAFVIISPHCRPCHDLLRHVTASASAADPLDLGVQQTVIVSTGARDETQALLLQHGVGDDRIVMIDSDSRVAQEWGITATPTMVIVDRVGKLIRQSAGFVAPPARTPESVAHT